VTGGGGDRSRGSDVQNSIFAEQGSSTWLGFPSAKIEFCTSEPASHPFADFRDESFLVGKSAGLEFRVHQIAVDREFEATAAGRLQLQALDTLLELAEDLGRQTDGLRLVASSRAVTQMDLHARDS
jgi:hypothetical protein